MSLEDIKSNPHISSYPSIPWMFGFEYRSKRELFGLPLIHVAFGYNPHTGLPRLARGVIAIGNFALGVVEYRGAPRVRQRIIGMGGVVRKD
jgi:hypothetical protein